MEPLTQKTLPFCLGPRNTNNIVVYKALAYRHDRLCLSLITTGVVLINSLIINS